MEFRWAAEGNTEELRQWLREHPERVNVPAKGTNMTLLYTCISNVNRTDLASIQAGYSGYLRTVKMLCQEYKADVLARNGSNHNTALHLAASIGATSIVRYLVESLQTPVGCTNAFGERPLQLAERHGHTECASILAAATSTAAVAQCQQSVGDCAMPSEKAPLGGPHIGTSGIPSGGIGRFQKLAISDSDDDDEKPSQNSNSRGAPVHRASGFPFRQPGDGAGPFLPATQLKQGGGSGTRTAPSSVVDGSPASLLPGEAHPALQNRNLNGSRSGAAPISFTPLTPIAALSNSTTFSGLPPPVRPRKEYDISDSRILANPDLQGFRFAYGDGFRYIQCSDHYEIRGILPYTYRGTVYYTPVIISVYAPVSGIDSAENTISGSNAADAALNDPNKLSAFLASANASASQTVLRASCAKAKTSVYCRYRVCLNIENLNGFAISRKAEYVDPISGAIIPAPGDDKYQTLTAYIRNVVVRNFEAMPPLIVPSSIYAFPSRPNISQLGSSGSTDFYRHHHSHNAPSFMRNALPNRSAEHLRCATVLRDLSKFGDGLARYFPAKHRIVAYVPIFSERKAAVLAIPKERPYATTVGQSPSPTAASTAAAKTCSAEAAAPTAGGKAGVTHQVAVEAVAELQVRVVLQFSPTRIGGTAGESGGAHDSEACVYAKPPRLYLVDAATRPLGPFLDGAAFATTTTAAAVTGAPASPSSSLSLTGQCFAGIIKDRETGEVTPELLPLSQESWSASGSVYDVLVELQRVLRGVLESFAMSYAGVKGTSPQESLQQQPLGSSDRRTGAPRNAPAAPLPLNSFMTPTMQGQPFLTEVSGDSISAPQRSSAGCCLYCMQMLQPSRILLQPCGHNGLCGLCVQRLQSHCREEVFACPVCRGAVRDVLEIFL
ncbi:Ankyrin repeats protein [Leishmania braziliensis]|nr:Ankyrin repeats protein [Leishmania braziliensis]